MQTRMRNEKTNNSSADIMTAELKKRKALVRDNSYSDSISEKNYPEKRVIRVLNRNTVEQLMQRREENFQEYLLRLMRERNLDAKDIYKPANLDRRLFSKIINDKDATPKKRTVIAIALAMQLDLKQTAELLSKAGFVLTANNEFDVIIRWCIENHCYNIVRDVNPILYECNLTELGSSLRA